MRNLISFTRSATRLLLLAGLAIFPSACEYGGDLIVPSLYKTVYGSAVAVGRGEGRAWVMVDLQGIPSSIGIDIDGSAISSLPNEDLSLTFPLPKSVAAPPYNHVDFGWHPGGHEPPGIYDVPHFDFHFYTISEAVKRQIPFLSPPAFDTPPDPKYIPATYFQTPGLVPAMGSHWIDGLTPEFNGDIFTRTFIYGSYQAKVIFLEPMLTLAYLTKKQKETIPLQQPQAVQRSGYYPTSYTISYNATTKQYRISLDNLNYRKAQ